MSKASVCGVITTTFASRQDARRVGEVLLKEKLAACVQLIDIESHYVWKGETRAEPEVMLLAKSRADLFARAIARIKSLHPYEVPEIVAQHFTAGFPGYLDWIVQETA